MPNRFSTYLKKKVLKKNQNLVSLDDPYDVLEGLLKGHSVKGILDAGASNGHVSKRMLIKFPSAQAYAFEPNPMYKDGLVEYAKRDVRFHPQFLALSDHEGTAELNITASAGNTSLLNPSPGFKKIDPEGSQIRKVVKVPLVTIDGWAKQNGGAPIEIMKFDIQGSELAALKGATETLKRSTLIVYSEIWFNCAYEQGSHFGELDLFLRDQGFAVYDFFKPGYGKTGGQLMWANAIFIHADKVRP